MTSLYYTAPSDQCFNEMKSEALAFWRGLDSHPSYIKEKVDRIENIENVGDNFMYILAMFDSGNQRRVLSRLSEETRKEVRDRMIDGGAGPYEIDRLFN